MKKWIKVTWAEFDFCEGTRKVSLNRILYIESKLHKLEFHVMEDCLQKYTLQTIRKYGGSYVIQNDEREFYFSIMIPLVKSDL